MAKEEQWIDRETAAELMHCSVRTVERYLERGWIQRQFMGEPGSTKVLLKRADVLAVVAGRPTAHAQELMRRSAPQSGLAPISGPPGGASAAPPEDPKGEMAGSPWISLERAAELHLFPLPFLRRAAEDGLLDAIQVLDSAKAQRWLVHRDCLMDARLAERWREWKRMRPRGAGA